MINNRKRVLTFKYATFVIAFILLYVLQSTPHVLSVRGVRPLLLIPAAVALAMYEGGFSGGLFGALAGALCDLGSFSFYGLYSVLLLVCAAGCGLLSVFLLQRSVRVAFLLGAGTTAVCVLLRFYFDYGLWGYEGIAAVFWRQSLPTLLYTMVFTPPFFWLFGKLEVFFDSRIGADV